MAYNQLVTSTGESVNALGGAERDQIISQLHGRKYTQAASGNLYGITGGLTTTTAAGAATFTGLAVGNATGSGYNLAVHKVFISQGAALTAETELGIMYGPGSIAASLTTIFNRKASGTVPTTITATAGATITAPTAFIVIAGSGSGAITVPGVIPVCSADFEGGVIIPPGYFFASYTSRVTTTALVFSFEFELIAI
mgnify:CR=1 FL=1